MLKQIISFLEQNSNPKNIEGMKRFKVGQGKILGISIYDLRKKAKEIGKSHELALQLWKTNIHEARLLACLIDEPEKVTEEQMDSWVNDFQSWDLCDQCCSNLFDKTEFVDKKIFEWVKSKKEFIRRAAFTLIASLSVHNKKVEDDYFIKFFPLIKKCSTDERNFVKKAVNWALRQIGKRNDNLKKEAIKLAEEIGKVDNKTAKWIANDALRELKRK